MYDRVCVNNNNNSCVYTPSRRYKCCSKSPSEHNFIMFENDYPNTLSIIARDSNQRNVKKIMPEYKQYATFLSNNNRILDHCYCKWKKLINQYHVHVLVMLIIELSWWSQYIDKSWSAENLWQKNWMHRCQMQLKGYKTVLKILIGMF